MSAVKGFQSVFKSIASVFGGTQVNLEDMYQTISKQGSNKVGADVALQWITQIGTGTVTAIYSDPPYARRILNITAHGLLAGQVLRFTSGANSGVEIGVARVLDANNILVAGVLPADPAAADAYSSFRYITPTVDSSGNISPGVAAPIQFVLDGTDTTVSRDTVTPANSDPLPVIQLDTNGNPISPPAQLAIVDLPDTPFFDAASTNIPASASNPLQIVASSASAIKEIQWQDDIGEFIGVYTGAALSEVLLCIIGRGGSSFGVNIPAATRISIRNMNNATISSGQASIAFLG